MAVFMQHPNLKPSKPDSCLAHLNPREKFLRADNVGAFRVQLKCCLKRYKFYLYLFLQVELLT